MNVNKNPLNGNIVDITFEAREEASDAMNAAQFIFGDRCAIVGLGDDFFKIVQEGGGVNTETKEIADIGDWWNTEWDQVTE